MSTKNIQDITQCKLFTSYFLIDVMAFILNNIVWSYFLNIKMKSSYLYKYFYCTLSLIEDKTVKSHRFLRKSQIISGESPAVTIIVTHIAGKLRVKGTTQRAGKPQRYGTLVPSQIHK